MSQALLIGARGVTVALAFALLGCQGDNSFTNGVQAVGTAAGGAIGGFVGSKLGGGQGNALATAAGVLVGAAVGNAITAQLTQRDRTAATSAVNQALNTSSTRPVSWTNPDSGNSGTFQAQPVVYEHRAVPAPLGGGSAALVPPPANPTAVAPIWFAPSSVNLRAAPSTQSAVVGHLRPHKNFQVLGEVPGSQWLIVAQNGQHVGYVSSTVVRPVGATVEATNTPTAAGSPDEQTADADQPAPSADAGATPSSGSPRQPSSAQAASNAQPAFADPAAIDRSGETTGTVSQSSGLVNRASVEGAGKTADVPCRTTISSVKLKGQDAPKITEAKFCQASDGSWVPVQS
jgi:surface antigen